MKHSFPTLVLLYFLIPSVGLCSITDSTMNETSKRETSILANLKFSASAQIWMRYTELNPGSQVDDVYENSVTDLSIRRFRMAVSGDVTDRLYVKVQIGLNNLNYLTRKSELRLLDLLAVYKLDDWIYVGVGKNGYTGPSRFASVASSSMLGVDIPIFALSTINICDDYLRKFSVFAKGNLGRVGYRLVLAKPNRPQVKTKVEDQANFSGGDTKLQTSGYFKYQFFEKESLKSAYMPGTYHGTKRILNLGFGFLTQNSAMWNLVEGDTAYYRMNQWTIDVFADLPLNNRNSQSITFYGAYFHADFGPNYARMIGVNNPSNGSDGVTINGAGNKYPSIGTGDVYYAQIGYRIVLPKGLEKLGAVQPYFNIQYANYDGLDEPMKLYESGINFLFNGHRSKLTFGWQSRPIYYQTNNQYQVQERKSMYVLQYQFKI